VFLVVGLHCGEGAGLECRTGRNYKEGSMLSFLVLNLG
jgi:hypothetical protein